MRIGSRQFSPKAWAVILYVAVLSCMLWLGNWQLNRAALKVSLQKAADTASSMPAVPLETVEDVDTAARQYRRVAVQGTYDDQRQFLWDNRTHQGQAGFEVLIPIRLDDDRLVLINRGWVALGLLRSNLPEVSLPESVVGKRVKVEGFLSRPSQGFASGDAASVEGSWPRLLQYLDYDRIGQVLGEPTVPALVQVQSLSADSTTHIVPTPRPEWLIANWQPAASGPATHYSYAFQWFAMATALTILFLTVNIRKTSNG
ncbi:MAG: SURF1 family protein [Granulosicoccus sp.]|nr:SURF1 family protein [Granulosicoccus sp.]